MKSVRLSSFLRKEILNSVLREFSVNFLKPLGFKTSGELSEGIVAEGRGVALMLWKERYGPVRFVQIPKWALDKSNKFSVAVAEDTSQTYACHVHWDDNYIQAERRPCKPAIDILITQERWNKLFHKMDLLEAAKEKHCAEKDQLRREIYPILESFNTTKQLLETWPSMEKFLPANIADPDKGINLPALSLSRLEAKINGQGG